MEIKTNLRGVDKYIAIVGILSARLLENEPFCSLQPKAQLVLAHLLYYRNDVYGKYEEEVANQLTFSTETKRKISDALGIDLVGLSNYTKVLKDKGVLQEDKRGFVKRFHIPNMESLTIGFKNE